MFNGTRIRRSSGRTLRITLRTFAIAQGSYLPMTKPQKVLIIGSGPTVIGQAAASVCRRLVDDAAGADDLAKEGVPAGIMVFAGRIPDGR